ncbi:MAG: hypothetical protein DCF27_12985 [Lysobacteraceae bacterium]|nr:MAG: hypothetical protein DCF27_12985 [Xanthomonadaceae bacterium]
MSLNKKLLAGTIAGLLVSANAGAVVLGVDPYRDYAIELTKPVTLTDVGDTIEATLNYNFSDGEVRYGRLECTALSATLTPVGVPTTSAPGVTLGAVNGAGTPALFFSITDNVVGGTTSAIQIQFNVTTQLLNNGNVDCAFSIYDQPSQAQAGGNTGRIASAGTNGVFRPFVRSVPSFAFTATPGTATADVEAMTGAYTDFLGLSAGIFGQLSYGLVALPPRNANGAIITMANLFAPATRIVVLGDFSAALAGGAGVELNGTAATTRTAAQANFVVGAVAVTGPLEYIPTTLTPILESLYTATLEATANAGFTIANVGPLAAGQIVRNGTQLQAPLAQVPAGYISRMVLTNTGNVARPYTIAVQGETGNTIGTANLTGTVPANGTRVIELPTVLTSFTAAPRATLNVTIAAPNNQIQGLYQIVNPAAGSVSNHIMVRPGTN